MTRKNVRHGPTSSNPGLTGTRGQNINKIAARLSMERKIVRKRIAPTQSAGMALGEGAAEQRVVGCEGPRVVPRAG
jgi:hypothetical protein